MRLGSLAAQDIYTPVTDPWAQYDEQQAASQPYRGVNIDPGLRRAPGDTAMRPAAQTFGDVVGNAVIPQSPSDVAMYALGGPLSRVAKIGALAAGVALDSDEAEAGKLGLVKRGMGHWSPFSKIAQPSPVAETAFDVRPTSSAVERQITPSDLQGSRLLPLVGDRTAAGGELTGIGGATFKNPTTLQGGHGYIRDMGEQGAVWASDKSPITTLLRRSKEADDAPLYGVYTAMGHRSGDFSHHASDTLMSMVDNAKITKQGEKAFNTAMRELSPEWPGLRSPKAREWLASAPGIARSQFTKLMDFAQYRDAGFPRVDQARYATTDPRLVDTRTGGSGLSVGSISGERVNPSNITPHRTYRDVMGGSYAGSFGQSVPFDVMYPDLARDYLKMRPDMRTMSPDQLDAAYVSMATKGPRGIPYTQRADQSWVDSVSRYLEDAQQGRIGDLVRQDAY